MIFLNILFPSYSAPHPPNPPSTSGMLGLLVLLPLEDHPLPPCRPWSVTFPGFIPLFFSFMCRGKVSPFFCLGGVLKNRGHNAALFWRSKLPMWMAAEIVLCAAHIPPFVTATTGSGWVFVGLCQFSRLYIVLHVIVVFHPLFRTSDSWMLRYVSVFPASCVTLCQCHLADNKGKSCTRSITESTVDVSHHPCHH